jgi:hypothetical protein
MVLERTELAVPVPGQGGQELLRDLHRSGLKPVSHAAPLSRLGALSPPRQQRVLRDGLTGDGQGVADPWPAGPLVARVARSPPGGSARR